MNMSSLRTQSTGGGVLGLSSVGSDRTGAASTAAGSHSHSHSHRKHHHHHRSRSAPRAPEKPPRKRHLNPGQSLASIPSQIKLSMLNSGLISFDDYNRVVLETIEGEPDSDYVNASYVDSILKPNAYIVTQGPMENTVTEFWRMVWQEQASCIVMLTKTFDFIRVMCVQYWPASKEKDEEYGGIGVSVLKEEELANFHIRTIRLYKKNENN
ncbi:hypothetical protein P5V15_013671, partial [Pogonomyrmex californicus]